MTDSYFSPPFLRVLVRCSVLGAILSAATALPAAAQTCLKGCGFNSCGTPGIAVLDTFWGELESAESSSQLPRNRDSTHFEEFGKGHVENTFPWFSSVDVEQGTVFTSTGYGVTTWNRQSDGTLSMVGRISGSPDFPFMAGGELSIPLQDVDAPPGNDDVVAVSGFGTFGIAIIDNRDPARPKVAYQNDEQDGNEVYAANIGGTPYAFLATSAGILVYDMDAALGHSRCRRSSGLCDDVYKGTFGRQGAAYVDGSGNFVVASFGSGRGFEIWDVSNPSQPRLALSALAGTNGIPVDGIALWSQGSKHYVALATSFFVGGVGNVYEGRTYDVSCITGTCGALGGPLDTIPLAVPSGRSFATFSRAGGRPFVFFGNDNRCSTGKRELVVDVSNPSAIFDVSPTGYWESISHFNRMWSGRAKFDGDILYRAANSVIDMHRLAGGAPPTASFTVPAPVYRDVPAIFTDTSTGLVESRSWTFSGGSPANSGALAPSVTFTSTGVKSVTLEVGNTAGSDTKVANVTVLDPTPVVSAIGQSPAAPVVCQPVTLTATATGPGLSYAWTVKDAGGATVPAAPGQTFNSNPFVWDTTALIPPGGGTYTATVVASSQHGSDTAERSVVLGALPGLPVTFAITNDPFDFGSVKFHAAVPGATEWSWDFGDGAGFGPWITDPIAGPHPTHDYTTTGLKNVKVRVRNCQFPNGVESAVLPVTIVTVDPLEAGFKATGLQCFGLGCFAETGEAITFVDESSGNPDSWSYAWNNTVAEGDGPCSGYGPSQAAPALSHTYTAAGGFRPCVKVTRGSEVDEFHFPQVIDVSEPDVEEPPPPPRVTVSGPTSGSPGVGYAFSASGTNCTPAANGWTWTTSGGTIAGSSTGASINVSWSSTGNKSVTARNSGCGSAFGSRTIGIGGGGGGGELVPQFSFSPSAPKAGQNVGFNASATTGTSQFYEWNFGDGGNGSGQIVGHAFATAGTFQVTLTVAPAGCSSPGCFKNLTKSVTVAPADDGGGGGGGGEGEAGADFTFAPAAPAPGQAVSFDGGASTGAPADFFWVFGDGATGSGQVVSHTFGAPGSYTVTLSVSPTGCSSPGCIRSTSKVVEVGGEQVSANGCAGELADDPDKLCLGEGRYIVEVDWQNQHKEERPIGEGQFRRLGGSESTGFFWFFDPESIDLIIKIIDGSVLNDHVWVFFGGLSDVIYEMRVTDTLTAKTKTYKNLAGTVCGAPDTTAFSTAGLTAPATASTATAGLSRISAEANEAQEVLHLLDGRFRVTVNWENHHVPANAPLQTGAGRSITGTDGSGYFWFFEPTSLDLVVKMIDAREFDGNFWVFYGSLTDVKYSLVVEDLVTGETWTREKPKGTWCGGYDLAAFPPLTD